MLFHEIYGSYFRAADVILGKAVEGTLTGSELSRLVREHAFGESLMTIPEGLTGGKWKLLYEDCSTPLKTKPSMPLTTLEKRWMKAVLEDPRIRLFDPDMTGLEDIQPLFTQDMLVYYDRSTNGDDYSDPEYICRFKTILKALREERSLHISFVTREKKFSKLFIRPCYLEYSEKEDRFRLVGAGRLGRWTINLSRITECTAAPKNTPVEIMEAETETVTFELTNRWKALDRVLLHFSHLEKETRRLEEGRYLVRLTYDREDENEIISRILSFGSVIRVVEPESLICRIRSRIEKQMQLACDRKESSDTEG